ncbi:hypothetical protein PG988_004921 [Apiospora saccharicola]
MVVFHGRILDGFLDAEVLRASYSRSSKKERNISWVARKAQMDVFVAEEWETTSATEGRKEWSSRGRRKTTVAKMVDRRVEVSTGEFPKALPPRAPFPASTITSHRRRLAKTRIGRGPGRKLCGSDISP